MRGKVRLSKKVQAIRPSSTLAISANAQQLKSEGNDVIGLGVGEPDFNTPNYIIDAAYEAMMQGKTRYTPSSGLPALKDAIVSKLDRDHRLTYKRSEIIVTTGAKHALYTAFQAILEEGDEVIIPAPYWVSYTEQVKLAGGQPVIVETLEENQFKCSPEQLEATITDRTKAIIINSPSNPTGMMYSKDELQQLGDLCEKHDLVIISDEIYEKLIYTNDAHVSMAELSEELKQRTIVINGVSKSHAMTGWRIGYAAGPEHVIQAMTNHASHATSNPTTVAQYAAIAAYNTNEDALLDMKKVFAERLDILHEKLSAIPGITCEKPKGAFYLFPNVKEAVQMTGFTNTDDWVKAILEEEMVALVPGSAFGAPDNVRLSYATSTSLLVEAADRIHRFVKNHRS